MTILWSFTISAFYGTALFASIPETPTNALRVKVAAVVVVVQGAFFTMWGFILPYIFNPNAANLGGKTFFIFAGLSALSFIYLFFFQPETANRSFEEIDELFHKRVPARDFKNFITDAQMKATTIANAEKLEAGGDAMAGKNDVAHVE